MCTSYPSSTALFSYSSHGTDSTTSHVDYSRLTSSVDLFDLIKTGHVLAGRICSTCMRFAVVSIYTTVMSCHTLARRACSTCTHFAAASTHSVDKSSHLLAGRTCSTCNTSSLWLHRTCSRLSDV
jgi:hypothetical protein